MLLTRMRVGRGGHLGHRRLAAGVVRPRAPREAADGDDRGGRGSGEPGGARAATDRHDRAPGIRLDVVGRLGAAPRSATSAWGAVGAGRGCGAPASSVSGGSGRTWAMPESTEARSDGGGVASASEARECAVAESSATSARQSAQTARCCSKDVRSASSSASTAYAPERWCRSGLMPGLPTCRADGSGRRGCGSWPCRAAGRAGGRPRCGCIPRGRPARPRCAGRRSGW